MAEKKPRVRTKLSVDARIQKLYLTNHLRSWIDFVQHFSSLFIFVQKPCIFHRADFTVKALIWKSFMSLQYYTLANQPFFLYQSDYYQQINKLKLRYAKLT